MKAFEELFGLATQHEAAAEMGNVEGIEQPLKALKDAAHQVERALSGSWLGYHSRLYYEDFVPPPPGAHFSQEWASRIWNSPALDPVVPGVNTVTPT
jgi:hypothetical protein